MGQAIWGAVPRVLIVDDDDQVRDILAAFVQELGYPISTARDGAEALRVLTNDPTVMILFSDIGMPGMDGEQLAERAHVVRPELRVILTSGERRPQGKYAFVRKPFRTVDLIKVLPPLRIV